MRQWGVMVEVVPKPTRQVTDVRLKDEQLPASPKNAAALGKRLEDFPFIREVLQEIRAEDHVHRAGRDGRHVGTRSLYESGIPRMTGCIRVQIDGDLVSGVDRIGEFA